MWTYGLLRLAATDMAQRQIKSRTIITTGCATAALLAVVSGASRNVTALGTAVLCAVAVLVVLGAIWVAIPNALGFGDVRLAAVAALMLGWLSPLLVMAALVAAQAACLVTVVVLAARRRLHRHTEIPLGTFIALASICTVLAFGR